MKKKLVIILLIGLIVAGYLLLKFFLTISEIRTLSLQEYYDSIDTFCNSDEDCEIKDVGNCCGYFPACVNKNAKTSSDIVERACSREELTSVCGWTDIEECKCINNACKGLQQGEIINELPL